MPVVHSLGRHSYRLVEDKNDGLGKVPAYDEEAFQLGITFKAKYVGTLEITRPTCRAEIVTAMRKVRYEFKIKGIEKRRVNLTISVDGIKVTVRKRRRRMRKEKYFDEEPVILHEHQIGRIFYVSHDSMDLKIFSYITKDNFDNQFRCSVFKAYRKSKALFTVRTIGQAFEVCHRLQHGTTEEKKDNEKEEKPKVNEEILADGGTDIDAVDHDKMEDENGAFGVDQIINIKPNSLMEINQLLSPLGPDGKLQPLTVDQLRLLFNQQLEHYVQETEVLKEDNQLLKDQLVLERNARTQAQEREHCLLQKNRELLQTIQALTTRLQTVNPGDINLSAVWNPNDTTFNPPYPTMYSTPHKQNNHLIDLMGNNSVVIPSYQPSRMAPLAPVENSSNSLLQTTVGLHWKTFDEDDHATSPGNATDDSTSDSSEDDAFSFAAKPTAPPEKTNGFNDVKLVNGSGVSSRLGTKSHTHNNGVVYNGLEMTENNNNSKTSEVRSAIQTDF